MKINICLIFASILLIENYDKIETKIAQEHKKFYVEGLKLS